MPLTDKQLPFGPIDAQTAQAATRKTARYQRHTQKIESVVERATHVDPDKIANRFDVASAAIDLQSMVDAVDPDFADFQTTTCNKTGQPLGTLAPVAISRAIRMHGRDKARTLLEMQHVTNVAPHWVETSAPALTELSRTDPIGYYVFAACKCTGLDGPYDDAARVANVKQHANAIDAHALASGVAAVKKRLDDSTQYTDAHNATDKGTVSGTARPTQSHTARFENVRTRARMYASLDQVLNFATAATPTLADVIETNELMRRLLALCHPRHLPQSDEWRDLAQRATFDANAMEQWQGAIRQFIGVLVERHIMQNYQHNKDLQQMSVDRMVARLASMRVELNGLGIFHRQRAIASARADEIALLELDDLFDTPISHDDLLKTRGRTDTATRAREAETKQRRAEQDNRFTGKLYDAPTGTPFKLNIGGNK